MATLSDFLRRVRPVAAPGPPARSGMPVDRAAERAQELAPVLAALLPTQQEAASQVTDARRQAEERTAAAFARVGALVADARRRADVARAEAASAAVEAATIEREGLVHDARQEAAAIDARAQARLPDLTARIVDTVRSVGRGEATRS